MVRDDGVLREATWDEALGRIVEKLGAVADASGTAAIGGMASARVSNEAAYLFQKFFRALVGTNNVDFAGGAAVRGLPTGLSAIADIAKSDLIVLVGFDPSEAAPLLDLHIKRAVRRAGAKLLIVNPRRIELARYTVKARICPCCPAMRRRCWASWSRRCRQSKSQQISRNQRTGAAAERKRRRVKHDTRNTQYPIPNIRILAVELLTAAKSPLFIYGPDAAEGERGRGDRGGAGEPGERVGAGR